MSRLRLDLTDRTFADLLDIGRALIPRYAPQWTDHNLHDPGITLLELLAWTTEAQIYSLGRMRRDERIAYAALLGIEPFGPAPATGVLWPDPPTAQRPSVPWGTGLIVERGAEARTPNPEAPVFRTRHAILLTGARLVAVRTRLADGGVVDQTGANRRGGAAFQPFGPEAGPGDRLELEFTLPKDRALLPEDAPENAEVCLSLGILASAVQPVPQGASALNGEPVSVVLVAGGERYPLPVVEDSSLSLMRSGVLLLNLADVPEITGTFVIEIGPTRRGVARAPRVLRVEPNVLPVIQNEDVEGELHSASGVVAQAIPLDVAGLRYGSGAPALRLSVLDNGAYVEWQQVKDLSLAGPADRVYELDTERAEVIFGNGVNGRLPPPSADVLVSYSACAGAAGNLPRNQPWTCRGVAGSFGRNLDAMTGGNDALDLATMRREARRRVREEHALVTNEDLTLAALGLPLLEVARAHVIEQSPTSPKASVLPGTRTLILLRSRGPSGSETAREGARWLSAARRLLAPRMPLGERLRVIAPTYVSVRVDALLTIDEQRDPVTVIKAARELLQRRLAIVPSPGQDVWPFGRDVTAIQVAAWLTKVDGVKRVDRCQVYRDGE